MDSCNISAAPGTDIWRKPPNVNVFNGTPFPPPLSDLPRRSLRRSPRALPSRKKANRPPAPYQSIDRRPLNAFCSAQLTLSLTPTTQYDQAGLLLILHPPPTYATPASLAQGPSPSDKYWIKTGVELFDARPRLSTVACKEWADWSISPLNTWGNVGGGRVEVTIVVQRVTDHHGPSLWVYKLEEGGRREPLRETCWVFALDEEGAGAGGAGWEVEVAAYAARPGDGREDLKAEFKDIKTEWV